MGGPSRVQKSQNLDFLKDDLQPTQELNFQLSTKIRNPSNIIHLYASSSLFNRWHWDGGKKTKQGLTDFITLVVKHPDFEMDDITSAALMKACSKT